MIDFLRVEPTFVLKLLKHEELTLRLIADDHVGKSHQSSRALDDIQAMMGATQSFQIFFSVILRGHVADIGLVIAFLRQTKRDLIDKLSRGYLSTLLRIYWFYSFFLITKRWKVDNCHDILSTFTEQLSSPNCRTLLSLLEKQGLDHNRYQSAAKILHTGQIELKSDIDYKITDKKLKAFFAQTLQQPVDSLGLSFEKITDIERNQHEIASIIKSLRRVESSSGHRGRAGREAAHRGRHRSQVRKSSDRRQVCRAIGQTNDHRRLSAVDVAGGKPRSSRNNMTKKFSAS